MEMVDRKDKKEHTNSRLLKAMEAPMADNPRTIGVMIFMALALLILVATLQSRGLINSPSPGNLHTWYFQAR
jgi:hypothetical protein